MDVISWARHCSVVASAIEFIRVNAKQQPTLESVAEAVHMSPFHLQRVFSEWAGMSPKRFLLATISAFELRLQRPRRSDPDQLRNSLDLV
jgi:methylphosphotriester-DNA--protein-cysteine methyltransferase